MGESTENERMATNKNTCPHVRVTALYLSPDEPIWRCDTCRLEFAPVSPAERRSDDLRE